MMRKPLALPTTVMLILVILLSAARPAMAEDNRVAPGRDLSSAPAQHPARPTPPNWRPSLMSCWETRWPRTTSPGQPSLL